MWNMQHYLEQKVKCWDNASSERVWSRFERDKNVKNGVQTLWGRWRRGANSKDVAWTCQLSQ